MKYKELNKNQKDRMKQISSHSYTRRRDVGEFCGGKNWGMCGLLPQMWGISYGVSQYNFVYGLPGMRCPPCCVREERQGIRI